MKESFSLPALPPNIIGATGGSGTRVIARIAQRGGMFTGARLNESEDAVDFGGFSDRWINSFLKSEGTPRAGATERQMRRDLDAILAAHCAALSHDQTWGWKEPRSIFLLPFYHRVFPSLKFLHVVRDGRDMAYSKNQNQLRKHGRAVLSWRERLKPSALRSITIWSRVNLAAASYGERRLREQYMRLRFEDLCRCPVENTRRILHFFELTGDPEMIARQEVSPPASLGRWRAHARIGGEWRELQRTGERALREFGYLDEN